MIVILLAMCAVRGYSGVVYIYIYMGEYAYHL
jgi:hypothetical protein